MFGRKQSGSDRAQKHRHTGRVAMLGTLAGLTVGLVLGAVFAPFLLTPEPRTDSGEEEPRNHADRVRVQYSQSRTLVCSSSEDAEAAIESFLDGLGDEYVRVRSSGRAVLHPDGWSRAVELLWGENPTGDLVIRAREGEGGAGVEWVERRVLEGVRTSLWVRGVEVEAGPVADCVLDDRDALYDILAAFSAEMIERGLAARQEQVMMAVVQYVARDADDCAAWLVEICPDTHEEYPVCIANLADPFDPAGERSLLEAVLRRALHREVLLDGD